jgi:hypothetical protein
MTDLRCPGQDLRYWKPKDIFETMCVHCGKLVEFFKDDPKRSCPFCGKDTLNPRNDLSCAEWCKSAKECLEALGRTAGGETDLVQITKPAG